MIKWQSLSVLLAALKEAGVGWHNKSSILAKERSGKLTLPRLPGTHKTRVVTDDHIVEIIEAFSPGGPGEWHYKENK